MKLNQIAAKRTTIGRHFINGFIAVVMICSSANGLMKSQSVQAAANVTQATKVSFTFDDGLDSTYKLAAPTLQQYGFTGTDYVISGCAGMTTTPNTCHADPDVPYMSWAQIKALHDTYGWEIGSHTVTHPYLATSDPEIQPNVLTPTQVTQELSDSKTAITANTGIVPTAFASPYGDYNPSGNPVLAEVAKLYSSHRGFADTGYNVTPNTVGAILPADDYVLNDYLIRDQQVQAGVSVATVKGYVDKAIADKAWLVLTFHEIKASNASTSPDDYQYNNADLSAIAAYVQQKQVPVVNISNGLTSGVNNLLPDGDLNNPLGIYDRTKVSSTQWTTEASSAFTNDSGNHGNLNGSINSVAMSAVAGDSHLFSPLVLVDPAKDYIMQTFVNGTQIPTGKEIAFYVDEYKADGSYLATQYKQSVYSTSNPLVKNYSFTYKPTAGAVAASLQILVPGDSAITGYLDNIRWFATDDSLPITTPVTDLVPPVISAIAGSNPTSVTESINWTTDEASSSQVEYGLTTAYGNVTALAPALVTTHSVGLSGLSAGTEYHYRVISTDAAGNIATSLDNVFTTPAITTPVITTGDVNSDGVVDALDLSVVLSNWGQTGLSAAQGDLNGDGVVDALDLSTVLANWSK